MIITVIIKSQVLITYSQEMISREFLATNGELSQNFLEMQESE